MSVVLADIGPETESMGDVISSSNTDKMKEDTQSPVSAPASIPASIPDATLRQSKRTNVKQGAEYRESIFDAQHDKYYGTQGTQHFQKKYKQGFSML
eukprot:8505342-Ditylum_brightwellii.AAC.1